MRRLIHLVILVAIIVGLRAWGPDAAQDRLSAGLRWTAERTGLVAAGDLWREQVRPWLGSSVRSAGETARQGLATGLDRVGDIGSGGWRRAVGQVADTTAAAARAIRRVFTGESPEAAPPQSPPPAAAERADRN